MVALPKHVWLGLVVLLIGVWVVPVQAASEDAALFQEALAPYGQWLQHNRYGLVWRPSRVEANWRPYTNGRWVLTQDGYVFETDEPWGWATYHYGNWQNTPEYGWIWIPGRTWYPHTVTWRANDEHVGWAPVPPPDTAATDTSSWFGDDSGALDYGSSGYAPASLPPTSWIFTRVNDFLYGWGEPYSSRYSYYNAGLLAAPQYVPVIYERTVYIYNYVTPAYAPRACYNWGPSVTYITKVTHINQQDVHRRAQRHRLQHLHNALPPKQVMERHPAWRQLVPVAATEGQRSGRWWTPVQTRNMALNRPDALPRPASLPQRPPVAAPSPVPAPDQAAVGNGQPPSRPGPRSDRVREVGPSPADAGGRLLQPGRPQPDQQPTRVGAPAAGITTADRPARPPLSAPASSPVTLAPQGADSAAKAQERRPVPPTLRPPTSSPNDSPGVSAQPSPPLGLTRPPATPPGQPGREAVPVLRPEDRRAQEEQHRRRVQEQEEFRQQAIRRQHQEQQQRQALSRHQQEQQRQSEIFRQQQEQQRRQAEMLRQQQEQQRRQMEMIRQQQVQQQQRQAEMLRQQQALQQQHQAAMARQQQEQQRRQAERQQHQGGGQPAPPAEGQKRRPRLGAGF